MKNFLFSLVAICLLITNTQSFAEPLAAKEVFHFKAKVHDPNTLHLKWEVKPGYFLYRDRLCITSGKTDYLELAPLKLPEAEIKIDGLGKPVPVYRNKLVLPLGVIGLHPGESILEVRYQGCADDGFCYPPEKMFVKLTINTELALTHASLIAPKQVEAPPKLPLTKTPFDDHHAPVTLLIFLGLGLLLSFTPCVLPMIPVLSGILVGHGKHLSTVKAFLLSLSYVLSMALTYAAIGAVVATMGQNLQIILQSPVAISLFSLVFVVLALAMFGAYELKLPEAWQAKLSNLSYKQARGHYLGAALMGCLSTLILSPCVTAPLIGALGYIAQTGDVLLGTAALFCLGLGMGLPLLLIGASLGRLLPHAGQWMNTVKALFGLMLLAVAVYLMSRILPAFVTMLLWAGLLIFSGLTFGALKRATSTFMRFVRGLGIVLLSYGILILIGASLGSTDPLKPLATLGTSTQPEALPHTITVKTMRELNTALVKAVKANQSVLLDFYADWCTACKVIESTTLQHPEIRAALENVHMIKIDITENNRDSRALLHHFNVIAPPTFVFLNSSGEELTKLRLVGDISVPALLNHLEIALAS